MKPNRSFGYACAIATTIIASCGNAETKSGGSDSMSTTSGAKVESRGDMMPVVTEMLDRMKKDELTHDFDHDFATLMIDHDQAAVDLSEMELSKGTDTTMKAIAQAMVADHKGEIEELKTFLKNHDDNVTTAVPDTVMHTHKEGIHVELSEDLNAEMQKFNAAKTTGNADVDYATLMIIHHEMGIKMAKDHLVHGHHADVRKISQKAVDEDELEVGKFKVWLSSRK